MRSKPVIIMGAGGHAKVVTDVLRLLKIEIVGFVTPELQAGVEFYGGKILGDDEAIIQYSPDEIELVNGVGALPRKNIRWELAEKMRNQGYQFVSVIHPDSVVSPHVIIDQGVQIMAGSVIQTGTKIGQDSIINTGAIIDHDCKIAKNCHIAPGVVFSGGVKIGKNTHIGTGVKIIEYITINENCIVAAGTTIYKDILSNVMVKQRLDPIMEDWTLK